jgi:hypothetical protein
MAYIKSTLIGILALFAATIVYLVIALVLLVRMYPPPPGVGEVGFDLRVLFNSPLCWLIAITAFALGFYWELRRAR